MALHVLLQLQVSIIALEITLLIQDVGTNLRGFGFRWLWSCSAVGHLYQQLLPMPPCPEAVGSRAFSRTWGREGQRLSPSLLAEQGIAHCPVVAVLLPRAHCCLSPASALPAARVGPSVPRQDRPVREGTRVASIETGLAAAAAKLSQQVRGCLESRSCQESRALSPAAELCPT